MTGLHIEQINPVLTWQLRRDILYPGKYKHDMEMAEDEQGIHFGAFYNNKLAGVISLFQNGADFQFRKLAIATDEQQKGIGKNLLQYVTDYAISEGGVRLWCNARLSAAGFYTKAGFVASGKTFRRDDIDYVIMEKTLNRDNSASASA